MRDLETNIILVLLAFNFIPKRSHNSEKILGVELTFASSLTGLLSHLGSNIYKTQDQSF